MNDTYNNDEIFCNICGKRMDDFDIQENFTIKKSIIGYGSSHDGDGLNLHICCDCIDKIIDKCMIDPIVHQNTQFWFSMSPSCATTE